MLYPKRKYTYFIMILILCSLLLSAGRTSICAATMYMPDVTKAMAKPSYWSNKAAEPDAVLASLDEIKQVNQDIINGEGTGVWDMSTWTEDTYNGIERNEVLKEAAQDDADYSYNGLKAKYLNGVKLSYEEAMDQLYGPMIENCADPEATESMDTLYAICTERTTLRSFPSDQPLPDDPSDPDFDVQYLSPVCVGDPLILRGKSADGKYYCAATSYLSAWIPAEDIAICKDKAEWLEAWNFEDDKVLVVYDDKIITEDSNYAPETARRKLSMGTRLRIADREDWQGKINNRYAYNNYVVWMPVRLEDGSFKNQLALISEHCQVSEGYLPLTTVNLAKVIFNYLGNAYGWGGMLSSQDCSGYVRAVYQCFGLNLARNTTGQTNQPVRKINLSEKTEEEKKAIIKNLPLGSELLFQGHAMLYLGSEGDKLYVISSVSNLFIDGTKYRVRGTVINTLDVTRTDGSTWLANLHTAAIPWYQEDAQDISGAMVEGLKDTVYNGNAQTPKPQVSLDGQPLKENVHYILSYADNTEAGNASVTITGIGKYAGTINAAFKISPAVISSATVNGLTDQVYNKTALTPHPQVSLNGKKLKEGTDYLLYYSGNAQVGTATIKIQGKGNYNGVAPGTFRIIPKGTSITKLKKGKRSFAVRWKKQTEKMPSAKITGYQVQYATNKDFTTGKETLTIKKNTDTSKKVTQLKGKKKYYVRIRTYMTVGKQKYYSNWSKTKTVITKKGKTTK